MINVLTYVETIARETHKNRIGNNGISFWKRACVSCGASELWRDIYTRKYRVMLYQDSGY